ncbi:hypothetical protein [Shewanella japonica]|uniref:hypothetical protein n=1 Tax=Shewanella japonica TaxID=93973 RepID=UPI000E7443A3|nr:hypothetical protein [Shewanella japonica]
MKFLALIIGLSFFSAIIVGVSHKQANASSLSRESHNRFNPLSYPSDSSLYSIGQIHQLTDKQALICPIAHYVSCIKQLPARVSAQLPLRQSVSQSLGLKTAMVMPVVDQVIAGIVVINDKLPVVNQSVALNGQAYQFNLEQQTQLTLWHELGHLENISLQESHSLQPLTPYQHEWLADYYLAWRLAHESGSVSLIWQQLHRRNIAVMNTTGNIGHWSSPQLLWLLNRYEVDDIIAFEQYADFIADAYPHAPQINDTEMDEISSLMQRTFGRGAVQALPHYMFWQQQRLIEVLHPTLVHLMGAELANAWLIQQFSEAEKVISTDE